jgi:hypothetical protein
MGEPDAMCSPSSYSAVYRLSAVAGSSRSTISCSTCATLLSYRRQRAVMREIEIVEQHPGEPEERGVPGRHRVAAHVLQPLDHV